MKKKSLFLLALSAMVMGGCSKSEIDEGSINSTNAINFSTSTDKLTKGTVLDNTTAKNYDFGVYAYQTGQYEWGNASANPTEFMNDQLVEYLTDAWTYSPTKYWPASSDEKISFFGYMPMNSTADDIAKTAATTSNDLPVITFEQVMTDAANMTDFVVGKALDQTKSASTVTIPFNHVLTRLNFSAKTEKPMGSGSAVYISELKILGDESDALYKSGTYTMSDDVTTNGAWSNPTKIDTNTDIDATSILNKTDSGIGDPATTVTAVKINSSTTSTGILTDGEYLFLIPPYGTEGIKTENDIRLELKYEIITYDANSTNTNKLIRNEYTKKLSLPVGSLVEGKAYNAIITIGLDDVVLSANLTDWEDETSVDALPTDVTVSAATDVATNIDNAFTNNFTEFTITYEGDEGELSVDLSNITVTEENKGMDLVINLPNQSDDVDITIPDGYEGGITIYAPNATVTANVETTDGATYTNVTVTTAKTTFIIPAGVTVENLTILAGNVEVSGTLKGTISAGSELVSSTITFMSGSTNGITNSGSLDPKITINDVPTGDGVYYSVDNGAWTAISELNSSTTGSSIKVMGIGSNTLSSPNLTTIASCSFSDVDLSEVAYTATTFPTTMISSTAVSIKLPNNITTVYAGAFNKNETITEIELPETVTEIGGSAFNSCTSLTHINIPNNTVLGTSAFNGCSSLNIAYSIPDNITETGTTIFSNSGISEVIFPTTTTLTTISKSAFAYCSNITSLDIPDQVSTISEAAFQGTGISEITIPASCTTIEKTSFRYCSNLSTINLHNAITTIGYQAFAYTAVTEVTIPASVTFMNNLAFQACDKLQTVYFEEGESPLTINRGAFTACTSLEEITLPSNLEMFSGDKVLNNCAMLSKITCKATSVPPTEPLDFGYIDTDGSNYYTGSSVTGAKTLYVPDGCASKYTSPTMSDGTTENYWRTILQDKCGFVVVELPGVAANGIEAGTQDMKEGSTININQ